MILRSKRCLEYTKILHTEVITEEESQSFSTSSFEEEAYISETIGDAEVVKRKLKEFYRPTLTDIQSSIVGSEHDTNHCYDIHLFQAGMMDTLKKCNVRSSRSAFDC